MKYSVIRINKKQYLVQDGEDILTDKVEDLTAEVLLTVDGDKVVVGNPTVEGAKVKLEKIADTKGLKVKVFKYKSKSRYRKRSGFRVKHSELKVV